MKGGYRIALAFSPSKKENMVNKLLYLSFLSLSTLALPQATLLQKVTKSLLGENKFAGSKDSFVLQERSEPKAVQVENKPEIQTLQKETKAEANNINIVNTVDVQQSGSYPPYSPYPPYPPYPYPQPPPYYKPYPPNPYSPYNDPYSTPFNDNDPFSSPQFSNAPIMLNSQATPDIDAMSRQLNSQPGGFGDTGTPMQMNNLGSTGPNAMVLSPQPAQQPFDPFASSQVPSSNAMSPQFRRRSIIPGAVHGSDAEVVELNEEDLGL